jgi:hypothetical protein
LAPRPVPLELEPDDAVVLELLPVELLLLPHAAIKHPAAITVASSAARCVAVLIIVSLSVFGLSRSVIRRYRSRIGS